MKSSISVDFKNNILNSKSQTLYASGKLIHFSTTSTKKLLLIETLTQRTKSKYF